MSTSATHNNQATVSWDPEPVRASMKNATDAFVDSVNPCATAFIKTMAVESTGLGVDAAGTLIKAKVTSTLPVAAPIVNVAIDTTTVPVAAFIAERSTVVIDSTRENVASTVKGVMHRSVDGGVDLCTRTVSFF